MPAFPASGFRLVDSCVWDRFSCVRTGSCKSAWMWSSYQTTIPNPTPPNTTRRTDPNTEPTGSRGCPPRGSFFSPRRKERGRDPGNVLDPIFVELVLVQWRGRQAHHVVQREQRIKTEDEDSRGEPGWMEKTKSSCTLAPRRCPKPNHPFPVRIQVHHRIRLVSSSCGVSRGNLCASTLEEVPCLNHHCM